MTHPTDISAVRTDIAAIVRARHTAKAYRPEELTEAKISELLDLLRFSASSVNSQPWHFVVATTQEGRDRVARAGTDARFAFNSEAVRGAGLVVIFAARNDMDDAYLAALLEQEAADGRFPDPSNKTEMRDIRQWFVDINRDPQSSIADWTARQVYWNGGQFLLGAAAMGLDATPMEGIDGPALDRAFGLQEAGYRALFAVTVGRNADGKDWNYGLPKSRLPLSRIVTRL